MGFNHRTEMNKKVYRIGVKGEASHAATTGALGPPAAAACRVGRVPAGDNADWLGCWVMKSLIPLLIHVIDLSVFVH